MLVGRIYVKKFSTQFISFLAPSILYLRHTTRDLSILLKLKTPRKTTIHTEDGWFG
jgi:hypothetical protein